MHILRCMGSKFCVKFQRAPLKFHTKFWTHTPQNMNFTVFYFCVWVTISLNCDVISLSETGPCTLQAIISFLIACKFWQIPKQYRHLSKCQIIQFQDFTKSYGTMSQCLLIYWPGVNPTTSPPTLKFPCPSNLHPQVSRVPAWQTTPISQLHTAASVGLVPTHSDSVH